jgi:two-component system chemotaxis response regulator CheB
MWNRILGAQADIKVVGTANNGADALETLKDNEVDLVLLDIEMPEMDGLTALPLMLKQNPGLRVIMASSLTVNGSKATIQALTGGASDYVAKPSASSLGTGVNTISQELLAKIRALSYPVKKSSLELKSSESIQKPTATVSPIGTAASSSGNSQASFPKGQAKVLVIGSSTGGPNALSQVLTRLNPQFQLPIVIVQHMPAFFIKALADRLAKDSGRPCSEIKTGDQLKNGCMYIAPGDFHAEFSTSPNGICLNLNQNPPENFCRPAVDPLFRSAAAVFGKDLIAVILTGMGEDGKIGCEEIRRRGGWIIAQDEATSVVWGMPGAVVRAGLADVVAPLDMISDRVQVACQRSAA